MSIFRPSSFSTYGTRVGAKAKVSRNECHPRQMDSGRAGASGLFRARARCFTLLSRLPVIRSPITQSPYRKCSLSCSFQSLTRQYKPTTSTYTVVCQAAGNQVRAVGDVSFFSTCTRPARGVALSHCQLLLLILPFLGIDKGPWMCQISTARSSAQEPATSIGWAAHVKAEYWTKTLFFSFLPVLLLRMAPNPTTSPSSLSSPLPTGRFAPRRRDETGIAFPSLSLPFRMGLCLPPKTQLFGVRCFSAGVPVVPRHITYLLTYLLRPPHSVHIYGVHAYSLLCASVHS